MLKEIVKDLPIAGVVARRIYRALRRKGKRRRPFPGTETYWEERYATGGSSGVCSHGKFAEFKAEILNSFVEENRIETIIELGCGDGNQLALANYPHYVGFDVSATAIALCRDRFAGDTTKSFHLMDESNGERADLALSLDVIYILVEQDNFEAYMRRLFCAATGFVIIYSSNKDQDWVNTYGHLKHRKFTAWVEANIDGWSLDRHIPNRYPYKGDHRQGSFADFFIYKKAQ